MFGARAADYGHPSQNFLRIAVLWSAWLSAKNGRYIPVDVLDVGIMMAQVKQARLIESPMHRDSHVDIAGYAEATARAVGIDE